MHFTILHFYQYCTIRCHILCKHILFICLDAAKLTAERFIAPQYHREQAIAVFFFIVFNRKGAVKTIILRRKVLILGPNLSGENVLSANTLEKPNEKKKPRCSVCADGVAYSASRRS